MELVIIVGEAHFLLSVLTYPETKTEFKKETQIKYTQPMRVALTVLVMQLFLS